MKCHGASHCMMTWVWAKCASWQSRNFNILLSYISFFIYSNNGHHLMHIFFTGSQKKFEYIIIYCYLKLSRIDTKFRNVVKVRSVNLCTKNGHHLMHIFFTGSQKKFEYIIIYCYLKLSRIDTKFKNVVKVRSVNLCTKNGHLIIHRF